MRDTRFAITERRLKAGGTLPVEPRRLAHPRVRADNNRMHKLFSNEIRLAVPAHREVQR